MPTLEPLPTSGDLPQQLTLIGTICLSRAVRRTSNLVTRVYNRHLKPLGLEVTQLTILSTIAIGNAKSASELADIVGVERSTLARNLDRLIAAGFVIAEAGGGRRLIHRLTPAGQEILARALPLWRNAQIELLAKLPASKDEEIRDNLRLLRKSAYAALAETPEPQIKMRNTEAEEPSQ